MSDETMSEVCTEMSGHFVQQGARRIELPVMQKVLLTAHWAREIGFVRESDTMEDFGGGVAYARYVWNFPANPV